MLVIVKSVLDGFVKRNSIYLVMESSLSYCGSIIV